MVDLQSIAKRFWARVQRGSDTECWPWLGATNGGYGVVTVETKPKQVRMQAHRVAAQLSGLLTDPEDRVKHSCGRGLCCNPKHLYLRVTPIELFPLSGYNAEQRSNASLAYEPDPLRRLLMPLRNGKTALLTLNDPKYLANPKYVGDKKNQLVVIAPGPMHGLSDAYLLISIVGSGSALVRHSQPTNVAKLVLAGMPVKLAHVLMNEIHQVLKE